MSPFRISILPLALVASPAALLAEDDHHSALPTPVARFHDIISKDWHAPEGPDKLRNACSHTGAYLLTAQDVVAAKAPAGVNAGDWGKATVKLNEASISFSALCAAGDNGKTGKGLSTLHDRFHDVVKLLPH